MKAIILAVLLICIAPTAQAEGEVLAFSVGGSTPSVSGPGVSPAFNGLLSWGPAVGLTLGKRLTDWLQVDVLDLGFGSQTHDQFGKVVSDRLSLGSAVRFGVFSRRLNLGMVGVQPYFLAGLGGSRMGLSCRSCGGFSDWGFEWSVGGGIQLAIDKGTAGVQYRYRSASIENADFGQHSLSVEFGFVALPDLVR